MKSIGVYEDKMAEQRQKANGRKKKKQRRYKQVPLAKKFRK